MFYRIMLAVLLVASAGLAGPLQAQAASDTLPSRDELEQCLGKIEHKLDLIAAYDGYKSLFPSEDADIVRMQRWFILAHQTIHNARQARLKGQALDGDVADTFHCAVREYRMNVEALGPGETVGKTEAPKARAKERLLKTLSEMVTLANGQPALCEVSLAIPTAKSTPVEAITYARRHLKEIDWLLSNRTLTYHTSNGTEAAREFRTALVAVSQSLDRLVDASGHVIPQLGKNGKPVDPLVPFKQAMEEARTQAGFYKTLYLPNARREEHRKRAQAIEDRLAADGFEKQVSAVTSLHEAAKAPASGT